MPEILPDCRAHSAVGIARGMLGMWQPVFCANCGKEGGGVPVDNVSFLFYLCDVCAEKHGIIAGTMMMPDEVFYEKLAQEQLLRYGRYLTTEEWAKISEDPAHPMWRLFKGFPR